MIRIYLRIQIVQSTCFCLLCLFTILFALNFLPHKLFKVSKLHSRPSLFRKLKMNRCQCFHIPQRWAPYCILATTSRTCRRENTREQTTGISLMSYTLEKRERRKGAKECKYRINSALYHNFY